MTWIVGRRIAFCEEFDAAGKRKELSRVCGQHKYNYLCELAIFEENELWKLFQSGMFVTGDRLGF